jgi:hypothetical protein
MIVGVEGAAVILSTPFGDVELTPLEAHALALALLAAVVEADHVPVN